MVYLLSTPFHHGFLVSFSLGTQHFVVLACLLAVSPVAGV